MAREVCSRTYSFKVQPTLLQSLKAYADQRGVTPGSVLRELIATRVTGEAQDVREALDRLTKRLDQLDAQRDGVGVA
jgi:hypothetical protein